MLSNSKLYLRFLCVFLLITLVFSGCTTQSKEPIKDTQFVLDTSVTISLYDSRDKKILKEAFNLCKMYEKKLSRTIPTSLVSELNNANGAPVTFPEEVVKMIETAITFSEKTEGMFDVTIAPISSLWDFKAETPTLPSQEAIEKELPKIDYRNIVIQGNQVSLKNGSTMDLGGIAKGFIADQVKIYLESKGIKSALINLGGNVLTVGSKTDGFPWKIGVQKPFSERNVLLGTVSVKGKSVVTSGPYERYFEIEGMLYHHILNPYTGFPIHNELDSVTIISEDSMTGDALSTSCFALGSEKGLALIETLEGVDAIFIKKDGTILKTSGVDKHYGFTLVK